MSKRNRVVAVRSALLFALVLALALLGPTFTPSTRRLATHTLNARDVDPTTTQRQGASGTSRRPAWLPKGAVRPLGDAIFDPSMASVGLYDPNAFGRAAPFSFYALEEDVEYKIPIVFVHGLRGSPRDFAALVANLDRGRFKPWFFYYPSGRTLDDSAQRFYELFLSGDVVPSNEQPLLVIAHDLGGLIVREALNAFDGAEPEVRLREVITISTPFGGYAPATLARAEATLTAPVWRDLNPGSRFMLELFRKPLPASLEYVAIYTYLSREQLERGAADDGVVEVASQLHPPARVEFTRVAGFRKRHTRLLSDPVAIHWLIAEIEAAAGPAVDERSRHLAATQP